MDYDDNDYQNQHFQLGGEDRNNFLRPFSLLKFDLDEHLPAHLRFGSLDESEDILGIRVQEGSNWIQDFSSGSQGIEFSSRAAESCVISRQNIWSEATSTESVEMLLKSVGEDDMLTNKSANDSATNQLLNSTNNDTNSASVKKESCLEDVINAKSLQTFDGNSAIIEGVNSIASPCGNAAYQPLGVGKLEHVDPNDLDKCSVNDGKVAAGLCDSSKLITEPPVKVPYLSIDGNSRVGDFDSSLNAAARDSTVSLDFIKEKSSNNLTASYSKDLYSEASEILISQIKDHRSLQAGFDVRSRHPDGHMPVDRCGRSEISSSLGTQVDSLNLTNTCSKPVNSMVPNGLLEDAIGETKLLIKASDACTSREDGHQLSPANSEPVQGHTLVDSCITEKVPRILAIELGSSDLMDTSKELIHDNGSDGLLEVIVDGLQFSNKDADVGERKGTSIIKSEGHSTIVSLGKIEDTDDVGSHDMLSGSLRDHGGGEFQASSLMLKGKGNFTDCPNENNKKQEHFALTVNNSVVANLGEEMQTIEMGGSMELELHDEGLDTVNKSSDDGLQDNVRSSITSANDSGDEHKNNVQSSAGQPLCTDTPLLSSVSMDLMRLGHACGPNEDKAYLCTLHKDTANQCSGSDAEDCLEGSEHKVETLDSLHQVYHSMSAPVIESFPQKITEADQDVAADGLPSLEVASNESKNMEMDAPCSERCPSKNRSPVIKSTGEVRSDCNIGGMIDHSRLCIRELLGPVPSRFQHVRQGPAMSR